MTDPHRPGHPEDSHADQGAMARVYVGALIVEAVIIAALWAFGRMYS